MAGTGSVFVVSSPSGGGKGTILGRVLGRDDRLRHSVSLTTRRPRAGEVDGVNYRFVDREAFERLIGERAFLEWAEVHGCLYGTLESELDGLLATGHDVVLELDVQGMRSVKKARGDAVSVFILPPSLEELERRLRGRGGLTEEELAVRLRNAEGEMAARHEYDHIVYNDEVDEAVAAFERIVQEARVKRSAATTKRST